MDSISIKICGPAGAGIMILGEILASSFERAGYYTLVYPEYPSRIRGGDNNIQIVVAETPHIAPREKVDFLFTMDADLENVHQDEVNPGGIFFEALKDVNMRMRSEVERIVGENWQVKNSAAAGIIWRNCQLSPSILLGEIKSKLVGKNLELNLKVAKEGYKFELGKDFFSLKRTGGKIFGATGNEVFALAAERAGVEYASIYPMTPITSIIAHLAKSHIKMTVPEDEIFAVLSCVGASYAGKRALTATSGGGFCLMTEAVGLAGMAEIPLVVILGQRTAPSSGLPTYTSQADLNFAINSSHGEFPKIVLAPGDLQEVSKLTQEAFNLADRFQLPVIILTDKFLSESRFSTDVALEKIKIKINRGKRYALGKKTYYRYKLTHDGISPRAYPGEVAFLTNSYEHDESGLSTDSALVRNKMVAKRMGKLKGLAGGYEVYGAKKSKTIIIGWGSTKTQLKEMVGIFPNLRFIHIFRPWPFPADLKNELSKTQKVVVVENNFSGQMAKIIENETAIRTEKILKDDGRPFFKEELIELIEAKL